MLAQVRSLVSDGLDWFFPVACVHCSRPLPGWRTPGLCPNCEERIHWHVGGSLSPARPLDLPVQGTAASVRYHGAARALIHDFKYRANVRLAPYLSRQMGDSLLHRLHRVSFDLLAPIPMHPLRQNQRGYNQAVLLARGLSTRFKIPVCSPSSLRRIRNTRAQALTAPEDRVANIAGAFRAEPSIFLGKSVLVVDDVMTTGATVRECANELLTSGAIAIYVCTWAD